MAACMTLPCLTFVYLAIAQPSDPIVISVAVCIEQFGYGFGFTAYMLYLIYFSRGKSSTAHYSFCTGFMALSMMLPGMVAGFLQESVGYLNFFIIVTALCLITFVVAALIKVEDDFNEDAAPY